MDDSYDDFLASQGDGGGGVAAGDDDSYEEFKRQQRQAKLASDRAAARKPQSQAPTALTPSGALDLSAVGLTPLPAAPAASAPPARSPILKPLARPVAPVDVTATPATDQGGPGLRTRLDLEAESPSSFGAALDRPGAALAGAASTMVQFAVDQKNLVTHPIESAKALGTAAVTAVPRILDLPYTAGAALSAATMGVPEGKAAPDIWGATKTAAGGLMDAAMLTAPALEGVSAGLRGARAVAGEAAEGFGSALEQARQDAIAARTKRTAPAPAAAQPAGPLALPALHDMGPATYETRGGPETDPTRLLPSRTIGAGVPTEGPAATAPIGMPGVDWQTPLEDTKAAAAAAGAARQQRLGLPRALLAPTGEEAEGFARASEISGLNRELRASPQDVATYRGMRDEGIGTPGPELGSPQPLPGESYADFADRVGARKATLDAAAERDAIAGEGAAPAEREKAARAQGRFSSAATKGGTLRSIDQFPQLTDDALHAHMADLIDNKLGTQKGSLQKSYAARLNAAEAELESRGHSTEDIWTTGLEQGRAANAKVTPAPRDMGFTAAGPLAMITGAGAGALVGAAAAPEGKRGEGAAAGAIAALGLVGIGARLARDGGAVEAGARRSLGPGTPIDLGEELGAPAAREAPTGPRRLAGSGMSDEETAARAREGRLVTGAERPLEARPRTGAIADRRQTPTLRRIAGSGMTDEEAAARASEGRSVTSAERPNERRRPVPEVTSVADYYGTPGARELAHAVKAGDPAALSQMAQEMAAKVPEGATIVPVPSRSGRATHTLELGKQIAEIRGGQVADVLRGHPRGSQYAAKVGGVPLSDEALTMRVEGKKPAGKVVMIDGVMGTGGTARAAKAALPDADMVVHSVDSGAGAKGIRRRTGAIGEQPAEDAGAGKSFPERLYSRSQRAIEAAPFKKGTAEQWAATLTKNVGQDERAALQPFLDEHKGKTLTKADVLQAHAETRIRLGETTFGGKGAASREDLTAAQQASHRAITEMHDELERQGVSQTTRANVVGSARSGTAVENLIRNYDLPDNRRVRSVLETVRSEGKQLELIEQRQAPPAKYAGYVEPGGTNYREHVLTLERPPAKSPEPLTSLPSGYEIGRDSSQPEGQRYHVLPPDQLHGRPFAGRHPGPIEAAQAALEKVNAQRAARTADAERGGTYTSTHWHGVDNPLVHVRLSDRELPSGEKALHVEEIQSDWHQKGRRAGYDTGEFAALDKERFDLESKGKDATDAEKTRWAEVKNRMAEIAKAGFAAPDAPFKKSQEWAELGLKKAIDEAVQGDYDRVTISSGAQQARRYDLSKQVDELSYDPEQGYLFAKKGGSVVHQGKYDAQALPDVIGKEAADKLLSSERTGETWLRPNGSNEIGPEQMSHAASDAYDAGYPALGDQLLHTASEMQDLDRHEWTAHAQAELRALSEPEKKMLEANHVFLRGKRVHVLKGQELSIGGEGMKGFYDKIIPDVLKDYSKKLGVKLELEQVPLRKGTSMNAAMVNEVVRRADPYEPAPVTQALREVHHIVKTDPEATWESALDETRAHGGYDEATMARARFMLKEADEKFAGGSAMPLETREMTEDELDGVNGAFAAADEEIMGHAESYDDVALNRRIDDARASVEVVQHAVHEGEGFSQAWGGLTDDEQADAMQLLGDEGFAELRDAVNAVVGEEGIGGGGAEGPAPVGETNLSFKVTPELKAKIKKEGQRIGAADPKLIKTLGLSAAGAAVGALSGSTPAERRRNALLGAIGGAGAGALLSREAKALSAGEKAELGAAEVMKREKVGPKEAGDAIVQTFAPQTRGQQAAATGEVLRARRGQIEREAAIAQTVLDRVKGDTDTLPIGQKLGFVDAIERGAAQTDAARQPFATSIRRTLDTERKAIQDLGTGKLEHFIENYFPHLWQDPDAATSWLAKIMGKRPLEGSKSFLKQRTIPTVLEGMFPEGAPKNLETMTNAELLAENKRQGGLVPVTFNPVEATMLKLREMKKYRMAQQVIGDLTERGLLEPIKEGGKMPAGYARIGDWAFAGKAAPEPVARVLNNYLSPGLRGNAAFDAYMAVGNTLNQAQLGLSAFHAGMTTVEQMVSQNALAFEHLVQGKVGQSLKEFATSAAAPVTQFRKGSQLLKAYHEGGLTGPLAAIADQVAEAGGRPRMTGANEATTAFKNALEAKQYARAGKKLLPALLERTTGLVLNELVPRQKLGVFYDLAQSELERLGPEAHPDAVRRAMQSAWDSVDNRLGSLVYDNLFWNKAAKDVLHASVRSVGWNWGTFRELGGGAKDLAGFAKDILTGKGKDAELSHRAAYALALPMTVGLLGAVTQYLYTGKGPSELYDYFHPKTGTKDADGNDDRVVLPSYMKDVYSYSEHPVRTLTNKMNPLLSMLGDMLSNKNFYGDQIYNPDDPVIKQLAQSAKFVAKESTPFFIQNVIEGKKRNEPLAKTAAAFVGITPASREAVRTKAQNAMHDIQARKMPQLTPEESETARIRAELRDKVRTHGAPAAMGDLRAYLQDGTLTQRQVQNILKDDKTPRLIKQFKSLTLSDAERVYKLGTQREQQMWQPILLDKRQRAR